MTERRSDRVLSIVLSILIHTAIVGALALAALFALAMFRNRRPDPKWTLLAGLLESGNGRTDGEEGPTPPHPDAR